MRKDLLKTVKTGFNAPDEVQARVQEQGEGLSASERHLLRFLPARSRILDIGCATGRTCIALAKEGHTVTGVDVAERLVEKAAAGAAAEELAITYRVCESVSLPFPSDVFDAVLLLKTYCYVPKRENRGAWLKEMARVLKPAGWLFLVQYTLDGIYDTYEPIRAENEERFPELLEDLEAGDGFSTHESPVFIHYFLEADLRAELAEAPFQLVDSFREETLCYYALKQVSSV